jgi:hypothetical protein
MLPGGHASSCALSARMALGLRAADRGLKNLA